jgi:hypothetical protein
LETIGAMQTDDGTLSESKLHSQTLMLKGPLEELMRFLSEQEGIQIDETTMNIRPAGK